MDFPNPNAFTGNPIDRCGVARKDPDWVAAQAGPAARWLPVHKGQPLIDRGERASRLCWVDGAMADGLDPAFERVLLGLLDGVPHWTIDVSPGDPPLTDRGEYLPLRSAAPWLPAPERAIAGQAVWLLDWHRRHRFCARHGGETIPAEGGFKRVHPAIGTEHFPRTDPVAIVLPWKDDHVCLGRGPHFPEGMFSALAGYVEACETLEECAARELFEEIGLHAVGIEYAFSQPWPFPASLMVGFVVEVDGYELTLDPDEIVAARWFSRDEAADLLAGKGDGVFIPPPLAIAHQLLKLWVAR
jgi:NAD+ diphosphatase